MPSIRVLLPDGNFAQLQEDGTWSRLHDSNTEASRLETELGVFRGLPWGSDQDAVRGRESAEPLVSTDELLIFQGQLKGITVNLVYMFTDGLLACGKYIVTEQYANKNTYLNEFNSLRDLMIQKYDAPATEKEFWTNELYRDTYSEWGMAVSVGHHSRFLHWERNLGDVWLGLRGEQYEIHLALEYNSKNLAQALSEQQNKRVLHDL